MISSARPGPLDVADGARGSRSRGARRHSRDAGGRCVVLHGHGLVDAGSPDGGGANAPQKKKKKKKKMKPHV